VPLVDVLAGAPVPVSLGRAVAPGVDPVVDEPGVDEPGVDEPGELDPVPIIAPGTGSVLSSNRVSPSVLGAPEPVLSLCVAGALLLGAGGWSSLLEQATPASSATATLKQND
jgi:hypothetical protein